MDTEMVVTGAIIDSWVEPPGPLGVGSRLVLQVAPQGPPERSDDRRGAGLARS